MQAFHSIRAVIDRIARQLAAARARSDFTCGECERWERCGHPPARTASSGPHRLPATATAFPDARYGGEPVWAHKP